jgi:hypothetical protein
MEREHLRHVDTDHMLGRYAHERGSITRSPAVFIGRWPRLAEVAARTV